MSPTSESAWRSLDAGFASRTPAVSTVNRRRFWSPENVDAAIRLDAEAAEATITLLRMALEGCLCYDSSADVPAQ